MRTEVNLLSNKINKIKKQIKNLETGKNDDNSFQNEMMMFLGESETEVNRLTKAIQLELEKIRIEMAEFLCEDVEQFKLEECFKIFSSFCHRFKLAVEENEKRRENQMKIEARKSNSQFKRNTNTEMNDSFSSGQSSMVMSGGTLDNKIKRRSRRDSDSDELHNGLLEFLKTANDLGTNENQFGSLRRVGSGRKRLSNPFMDIDLNRERNSNDKNRTDDDSDGKPIIKWRNRSNSRDYQGSSQRNSANCDLIENESDDEKGKEFNRFSPSRRTFKKSSELESKLAKRLGQIEKSYEKLLPNGDANNNIEEIKPKVEEINNNTTEIRSFWGKNHDKTDSLLRPTNLPLKLVGQQSVQHPTAVISPTKVEKPSFTPTSSQSQVPDVVIQDIDNQYLDNQFQSRLPLRKNNFSQSSLSSGATAAAIVTPLQLASSDSEKNESLNETKYETKLDEKEIKSKLPVRTASFSSRIPKTIPKSNPQCDRLKSYIPLSTASTTTQVKRIQQSSIPRRIPEMGQTYYKSSLVKPKVTGKHLVSTPIPISTTRRPSQITPANRPFMKQTSASAAKTRLSFRY